ncbi:MAG TPA: PIG-L family deacetylase, partial [Armatimonadota bacterium]|nr:PIG-L family deacetylase [Armatimonadota bacterium]
MTILLIGAHPDDEISAGGTITNHTRAGDRVVVLTATKGGMGHRTRPTHELIPIREKEAAMAAKTMGAELRMLD